MRLHKKAEVLSCSLSLKTCILLILLVIYPLSAGAQPFAYIASIAGSTVTVVNIANNSIIASPYIPGGMTGIAASPGGAMVYVTAQSANQVEVFSTTSNSVIGAIGVGATPVAVAFTPNGAFAYVANQASNTVSVINTASNTNVATIPVGVRPTGVAVNPSGTRVLVSNNWDTVLSVIDTASNTVIANIQGGFGLSSVAISPNGVYAYATNQSSSSLAVINLSSNTLVGNVPVQSNPTSVAVTPNGARVFVTNGNSNSVSVIDTASNSVIATIGVGSNPTSVAITPDGSRAEVTNAQGYSASLIDTNGLYVMNTLDRVGIFPSSVAIAASISAPPPAPVPCSYSLTATSQTFAYTGGSGAVGINVATNATGCNWTATSSASWISVISGLSGNGTGVSGFNVAPNPSTTSRTGNITIAGQTFTVTEAAAPVVVQPQPPTSDSVNPNSGGTSTQMFQAYFSDPAGAANITYVSLLINGSLSPVRGCWVLYIHASNALYLLNDLATAFLGPLTPGATGFLSNGQCAIDGGGSSVSTAGNTLTLQAALSFGAAFGGAKGQYMLAGNNYGFQSGWQTRGSWTVPGGGHSYPAPTADSLSPNSDGGSRQTFTATYGDPNGSADLFWASLLFNSSLNSTNSCWAVYNPTWNALFLYNDAGTALIGPVTPGIPGTLQNSQCILDAGASSAAATASGYVVNFALGFKGSFTGQKSAYMTAIDAEGANSGWQTRGSWEVR